MVAFAFLGNTLFLTILVSMLSNTFSNISTNAVAEIQFRKAVMTLEGVKADAVFAYQPPFNILAVFVLLPLKFVVSPRWFHKIHVASVRFLNLPLLLIIAVAERRLLWSSKRNGELGTPKPAKKWFWEKWHLSAHNAIHTVFELPPPEDVHQDIAVDDAMTHHLIRRQFTRHNTAESQTRKSSRRDSMFPGISKKLQSSLTEDDDEGNLAKKLDDMEDKLGRMEAMLSRLMPQDDKDSAGDVAVEDDEDDVSPNEDEGFSLESSYQG
jgi:acyl-CoA dehydrogenase